MRSLSDQKSVSDDAMIQARQYKCKEKDIEGKNLINYENLKITEKHTLEIMLSHSSRLI
jgi:hypothetical protein